MFVLATGTRILLACVFGLAGATKLMSGFSASRKSLHDFGVPLPLIPLLAACLPFAEIIIATLLLLPRSTRIGSFAGLTLLLIFNAAIVANLVSGRTPSCNCFGQLYSKPIGWWTLARNSSLASVAAWLCWQLPKYHDRSMLEGLSPLSAFEIAALFVAAMGFSGLVAEAFFILQVLRQNGRLLLRIEALELTQNVNRPLAAPTAIRGLAIGAKAIPFELEDVLGATTVSLKNLLDQNKPALLLFTDPNCGPCTALMSEVAAWQKTHASEVNIVLVSTGRKDVNREKAKEFGLRSMLVEKKRDIAGKYYAFGTPSAVVVRRNGSVGSQVVSGADEIRRLVEHRAWDEVGYSAFLGTKAPSQPTIQRPELPIGTLAPTFTLRDLDHNIVRSEVVFESKSILLFWNPSCGFCQKMLPELRRWEGTQRIGEPVLVLLSSGSLEASRAMGIRSTVLIDETFEVSRSYGAQGTPSGILVSDQGKILSSMAVGESGVVDLLASGAGNSDLPDPKLNSVALTA